MIHRHKLAHILMALLPFWYFVLVWPTHEVCNGPGCVMRTTGQPTQIKQFGPFNDRDSCVTYAGQVVSVFHAGEATAPAPGLCFSDDQPYALPAD